MSKTIYQVTITPYTVSQPEQGGFIDNKKLEYYGFGGGLTFDQAKDKKRANFRYQSMMMSLTATATAQLINAVATGATNSTAGSDFKIDVIYERAGQPSIIRDGETLTGADAVKQLIAESFITDINITCDVYDPTTNTNYQNMAGPTANNTSVPHGPRILVLNIGKLADTIEAAKANISVSTVVQS